jgi:bifunctional non-homologous end joining protein LigD
MEWHTSRPAKRPGMIEPCIPTRASKPPVGPQWIHEIKHDGYRLIARKREGRVRLFTRNGVDWTDRYPRISAAVAALGTASATIDGEAVWCDGAGLAIFEKLHSRAHDGEVWLSPKAPAIAQCKLGLSCSKAGELAEQSPGVRLQI